MEPGDPTPKTTTRLMILMFTDVVNSTRIKRDLGLDTYRSMVVRHDGFIRQALAAAPTGRIFQDNGDGYFAGFESISDALNCALTFQWLMSREPWPHPFSARVGLHLGQIEEMQNQATGQPRFLASASDMAARVMSLAKGGQLLLTRAVFDEGRQHVRQHPEVNGSAAAVALRWVAHGPYQFKGNDEPIEVFEVGAEGVGPFTTPPDSEKAKRHIRPGDEATLGWRPASGLEIPDQPNWVIAEKLGEGGFGEVWLARHRKVQTQRVFKFCFDAERLRALKREVVLFRLLKGALGERRDIARVLDFQFEKSPYSIEMEFVPDGNLIQWAEKQGGIDKVPIEQRIDIVAKIAQALAAAHGVAVLHKDLKPANILMGRSPEGGFYPRLADFGIGILTDKSRLADFNITALGTTTGNSLLDEASTAATRMYAPPESLTDSPHTVLGDVYALGVMLYQLYIGNLHRPLASGWERDVSDEIVREDIAACVEGDMTRRVATANDVAQRLARHAERRKQREQEAAARAEAEAAKVRAAERRRRKVRNRVIALILALALGIVGYSGYEYYLQWGDWIEVAHYDFTSGKATTDGLQFIDVGGPHSVAVAPWAIGKDGLEATRQQWCLFKDLHVRGDVRIVAKVAFGAEPDGFEMCLNCGNDLPAECPPGYSAQVGGYGGQISYISRNDRRAWPDDSDAAAAGIQPGATATITFERQGENIQLLVDKQPPIRKTELLPLTGSGLDGVAIRSWSRTIIIRSISIYRRSLPMKTSPVVAGDAVVEAGNLDAALRQYENLADDYPGSSTGEIALAKAFRISTLLQPADETGTARLHNRFFHEYPHSSYRQPILESDALTAWESDRWDDALGKLAQVHELDGQTRLPLRLLASARTKHIRLPASVVGKLMSAVHDVPSVSRLDIDVIGVESLSDVARQELQKLDCSDNPIATLDPLRGLPLTEFNAGRTQIDSLEPLRSSKLKVLGIAYTKVADLEPVRRMPITRLDCGATSVASIEALAGDASLRELSVGGTRVTDLEPIRGLGLRRLGIGGCAIHDLGPLRGMPLDELACGGCNIDSLEPLRGAPLFEVDCRDNRIDSIDALRGMPLKFLRLSGNQIRSLEPLRGMRLSSLRVDDNPLASLEPFVQDPPPQFTFACDSLPDAELTRVRVIWEKRPDHRQYSQDAAVLLALRHGDVPALQRLAATIGGRRYLVVTKLLTWDDAAAQCRALGGHLAVITCAEENALVSSLCRDRDFSPSIGLRRQAGQLSWENGQPVSFTALAPRLTPEAVALPNAVFSLSGWLFPHRTPDNRNPFIIEWD